MSKQPYHIDPFWRKSRTLGQALEDSTNLFTPLRMILALGVLLGHSFAVNFGPGIPEPLALFDLTISYAAVNGFFVLSGLLITRSIDRNPDLIRYFSARFLRLYPAMAFMVLVASFVVGPLVSILPITTYLSNSQIWIYICDVLSFGDTSGGPPQIFANNPFSGEWSASLWTLRYEAIAYAGTAILAVLGLSRSRTMMLALFVASISVFVGLRLGLADIPVQLLDLSRFAITYLLGAVLYGYRDVIRLSWRFGAILASLTLVFGAFGSFASYEIMFNFTISAALLLIGFATLPGIKKPLSRMPDFSYGVYIWQWPVMQFLWYFGLARDPLTTMVFAIPISVIIGALSWYTIEKPMLAMKNPLTDWLHRKLKVGKTA